MVDIIAWPPVGLTGWGVTWVHPVSRSASLITGEDFVSQAQPSRRMVTAVVGGIGRDRAQAGYMEMLKKRLAGVNLVRMPALSPVQAQARSVLRNDRLTWMSGAVPLEWDSGAADLIWGLNGQAGTAGTEGGYAIVSVTGFPPNAVICRPSETVTMINQATGARQVAQALRVTVSDGSGAASIRIDAAFTGSGWISIGDPVSLVLRPVSVPDAVQPVGGDWSYSWQFREVLDAEIPAGSTDVDPWR